MEFYFVHTSFIMLYANKQRSKQANKQKVTHVIIESFMVEDYALLGKGRFIVMENCKWKLWLLLSFITPTEQVITLYNLFPGLFLQPKRNFDHSENNFSSNLTPWSKTQTCQYLHLGSIRICWKDFRYQEHRPVKFSFVIMENKMNSPQTNNQRKVKIKKSNDRTKHEKNPMHNK